MRLLDLAKFNISAVNGTVTLNQVILVDHANDQFTSPCWYTLATLCLNGSLVYFQKQPLALFSAQFKMRVIVWLLRGDVP